MGHQTGTGAGGSGGIAGLMMAGAGGASDQSGPGSNGPSWSGACG
jgi:hypothetical protein